MNNNKDQFKYQYSDSINGRIIVVRADSREELLLDIEWLNKEFGKPLQTPTRPVNTNVDPLSEGACQQCGAPVTPERKIKWKYKEWLTRECTSGARHKTGYFKPAE